MPGIALESPVIGTGIADLEVNFRSISEQRLFRGYQYFTDNDMANTFRHIFLNIIMLLSKYREIVRPIYKLQPYQKSRSAPFEPARIGIQSRITCNYLSDYSLQDYIAEFEVYPATTFSPSF